MDVVEKNKVVLKKGFSFRRSTGSSTLNNGEVHT